jgi:hypothetical protein
VVTKILNAFATGEIEPLFQTFFKPPTEFRTGLDVEFADKGIFRQTTAGRDMDFGNLVENDST